VSCKENDTLKKTGRYLFGVFLNERCSASKRKKPIRTMPFPRTAVARENIRALEER
jgi:hypothetical protein